MLTRSEIRIAVALAISLVIHGMVIVWDYRMKYSPVASPARKKVTFQLVARHVTAPVKEDRKLMPQTIPEKRRESEVVVRKKPFLKEKSIQPVPESVEVEVIEIPVTVQEPVAQEPQPLVFLKDAEVTWSDADTELDKPDNPVVVMATPLYRQNPPPSYPVKARRKRQEGSVILEVLVNSHGKVDKLLVKESSGHRILDQAAVSSVRKWVFEPGRRNGIRISMTVLVPVRFKLQ